MKLAVIITCILSCVFLIIFTIRILIDIIKILKEKENDND